MLAADSPTALEAAREILLRGGVLAFPTETVYGLGVLYGNTDAEERLRALKGRDSAVPFQVLVADVAAAETAAEISPAVRRVLAAFWPGALTAVLPARGFPGKTIGLRAPDSPWLQQLLRTLPSGITATSANLSGLPPARNAQEAQKTIGDRVDLLLDGGESAIGRASTVASFLDGRLQILRAGSVSEDDLRRVFFAD